MMSFEYAMQQESVWRMAEYATSDHAEKARCHAYRWHWMTIALKIAQREG